MKLEENAILHWLVSEAMHIMFESPFSPIIYNSTGAPGGKLIYNSTLPMVINVLWASKASKPIYLLDLHDDSFIALGRYRMIIGKLLRMTVIFYNRNG